MMRKNNSLRFLGLAFFAVLAGCGAIGESASTSSSEVANALGDTMGAVDESLSRATVNVGPMSGGSCYSASFTTCASNARTLTYDGCSLGNLVLTGEVKYQYSVGASCRIDHNSDSVRRIPDFVIAGREGSAGVGSVSAVTSGQTITRVSNGVYTYAVSGIRRYLDNSVGTRIADFTVNTTSNIQITGSSRSSREMSGGSIQIASNLENESIVLSPDSLRWTASCSCPISGSWIGQKTDTEGVTSDFVVEITGCGTANLEQSGTTKSISLERCFVL
ncbi:MAG: hypothetical protein ABIR96_06935 [Bdellovibrionota bacterium]